MRGQKPDREGLALSKLRVAELAKGSQRTRWIARKRAFAKARQDGIAVSANIAAVGSSQVDGAHWVCETSGGRTCLPQEGL
jgi:hypothetical protein